MHTKAAYILLCSKTTTEDTVFVLAAHEHFKHDSLNAAGKRARQKQN